MTDLAAAALLIVVEVLAFVLAAFSIALVVFDDTAVETTAGVVFSVVLFDDF